jgi:hypothetical protein
MSTMDLFPLESLVVPGCLCLLIPDFVLILRKTSV